jgi:hypothetical protein
MSILIISRPDQASSYGAASVSFIYVFTLIYSSSYLIIIFNYPAETFPTEVRGRSMAFGVCGWAIGLGCGILYNPVLFKNMGGKGFFIFGRLNILFFILVLLFLPETSERSLEAINTLFEAENPFNRATERHYQEMRRQGKIGDEESTGSREKVADEENHEAW